MLTLQLDRVRFEEGLGNNRPVSTRLAFGCCGVRVDALALDAAVPELERLACAGRAEWCICNANNLALAVRDVEYRRLLNEGRPEPAGRRTTRPLGPRTVGPGTSTNSIGREVSTSSCGRSSEVSTPASGTISTDPTSRPWKPSLSGSELPIVGPDRGKRVAALPPAHRGGEAGSGRSAEIFSGADRVGDPGHPPAG